jgi:hypothetical protein
MELHFRCDCRTYNWFIEPVEETVVPLSLSYV